MTLIKVSALSVTIRPTADSRFWQDEETAGTTPRTARMLV